MAIRTRQRPAASSEKLLTPLPLQGASPSWPEGMPTSASMPAKAARRLVAQKRSAAKPAKRALATGRARAGRLGPAGTGGIGGVGVGGRGSGARFGELWGRSKTQAEGFAREVIDAQVAPKDRVQGTRELVHWASASGTSEHRRLLVQAFKASKAQTLFVHHLSELPSDQADVMMKDFFDGGGDESAIAEWLVMAGRAGERSRPVATASLGRPARRAKGAKRSAPMPMRGLFDWVGGVVDWVADAISTVVDAVVKAGKSLVSVIGKLVNMTLAELTDAAKALKKAGRAVGELLSAAATQAASFLDKMVKATLAAAYSLASVVSWLASQAVATAKVAVQALLALGHSALSLMKTVASLGAAAMQGLLRALMAAGKGLAVIVAALAGQLSSLIQSVVGALRALGQAVRAIIVEAIKLVATTARLILNALRALGTTLTTILSEAASLVAQSLRTVLSLLVQLGHSVVQLVQALAALAAAQVRAVLAGLLALGKTVAELVLAAVAVGVQLAHSVFSALLALGRNVSEILVAMAGRTLSALRTTLEALIAMGQSLQAIVRGILTDVAEGFRRGFFEGLMALGKSAVELLKTAVLSGVALGLLACTVLLEIMGGHRPLSAQERAEALRIFGAAIDLDRVKISVASLPADLINYLNKDRPFTTMYIINFGRNAEVEMHVLIHELTHVWQGVQEGPLYMTRALEAQLTAGLSELFHTGEYNDEAAYVVNESMLQANGGDFGKFNPEQQAWIVQHYWLRKFAGMSETSWPSLAALEPYALQVFKDPASRSRAKRGKGAIAGGSRRKLARA